MKIFARASLVATITLICSLEVYAQSSGAVKGVEDRTMPYGALGKLSNGKSSSQDADAAQSLYNYQQNALSNQGRRQQADFDLDMQQKMQKDGQAAMEENALLRQNMQDWQNANGQGRQARNDDPPKAADVTRGCPYLIKTQYGLTHPPGAKYCVGNKTLECVRANTNAQGNWTYRWRTLSENVCQPGAPSPDIDEKNTTSLVDINKNFFEEF